MRPFPSRFLIGLTGCVLWLEWAWPAFCPAVWIACLFAALSLFSIPTLLPGFGPLIFLAVFGIAFGGMMLWGIRHTLRWPTHSQILRRLERDTSLEHRPLSSAHDTMALNETNSTSQALWLEYRRRLQRTLPPLQLAAPLTDMPRRDPWGIRFVAPLLLVIALGGTWREAPDRLWAALNPDFSSLQPAPPHVQLWLTPPAYTHLPPVLLDNATITNETSSPISIPTGSTALLLLQGGRTEPFLMQGERKTPFVRQGDTDWRLEGVVVTELPLSIVQGRHTVVQWPLALIPDTPPTVSLTEVPKTDPRGRFQIFFNAADDYGLNRVEVLIGFVDNPHMPPLVIALPSLPGSPATLKGAPWLDLASHPMAGQSATLRVQVWDEAGQSAESSAQSFTLPKRVFTDPAALAVIAQRTALIDKKRTVARDVSSLLLRYAQTPDIHRNNPTLSLALSTAAFRLARDSSEDSFASVLSLLWNVAVTLEDGMLGDTARALEQARKDLEEALASDASDAEIQARIDQLEQALANHLQAMMQTMQQNGVSDSLELLSESTDTTDISTNDLGSLLEQMRSLSQMGSRDAARQALERAENMLESLQNARPAPPMSDEERQARQAMADIKELVTRQRALIDETFRIARQDEKLTLEQTQTLREQQATIRKDLQNIRDRLDNGIITPPESIGKAGEAMRDAEKSLRRGNLRDAQKNEEDALSLLEEGLKEGSQQMAKATGGRLRLMLGRGSGGGRGQNTDPLGRSMTPNDDGSTQIPTQDEAQKAHQILEELRNRAGDLKRPEEERNYLNRLLKRF